jgi:uncharacterized protein
MSSRARRAVPARQPWLTASGSAGRPVCSDAGIVVSTNADDDVRRDRRVRCPTCRTSVSWSDNPQRPFCSFTCRLIDLGVWLEDGYALPAPPADDAP